MVRKDYRAIADAIRELKMTSPIPDGWDKIIVKLSQVLKKDNPRFSEQKFWDYIQR